MRKHCSKTCTKLYGKSLGNYGGEFSSASKSAKERATKTLSSPSSAYLACSKGLEEKDCVGKHFQNLELPPAFSAVLAAVDRVYVLCIGCEKFKTKVLPTWPEAARAKIKLWDGRTMSDDKRCLSNSKVKMKRLSVNETTTWDDTYVGCAKKKGTDMEEKKGKLDHNLLARYIYLANNQHSLLGSAPYHRSPLGR
jgi:hypothetical protein